jgi:hypothetical protein
MGQDPYAGIPIEGILRFLQNGERMSCPRLGGDPAMNFTLPLKFNKYIVFIRNFNVNSPLRVLCFCEKICNNYDPFPTLEE